MCPQLSSCLSALIKTEKEAEVRRAAVHVITLLLRGLRAGGLAGHHRVGVAALVHHQLLLLHLLVDRLADLQHLGHEQVAGQRGDVRHHAEVEGQRRGVGEVQERQEAGLGEACRGKGGSILA